MAKITVNGATLHYEDTGTGPETIIFSHGLLFSGKMFEAQVAALKARYRCITFDFRGQGQSEVTATGYDMETLYQDTVALIENLKVGPCHFVGLSMGGFMGMRLAARRPDLLKSLILLDTSADPEPPENIGKYRTLNLVARWLSMKLVINKVAPIMFGTKFRQDPARAAELEKWKKIIVDNHKVGITRAVSGVIDRQGVYDEIGKISLPTLIMVGDQDVATIPAKSARIQELIAGSKLEIIPGAGHSSSIEEAAFVTTHIDQFLQSVKSRVSEAI